MKSLSENIYLKSPSWLQNILISVYGYKVKRTRYGGNYQLYLDEFTGNLKASKEDLVKVQNEQFLKIINQAVTHTPYYRDLFKKVGLDVSQIKDISDIRKIPVLEKDPIREGPKQFISETCKDEKLLVVHTTGTTGTPLQIYATPEGRQENYAFFDRYLRSAGIDHLGRKITIGGRVIIHPDRDEPPFWRHSYFQRCLFLSSYHLSDKNMPAYIAKIREFRPEYIDAYPSSLYSLAMFAQQQGVSLKGVTNGIVTSAETLFPDQREAIEAVFETPVIDQYGAVEMCVFVGQCVKGKYHIHTDYGVLEFLREDGSNASPGEEADLVCTGFINRAMPLIRYRIGDRGAYSDKPCECGSPFPVLEKIVGRIDDVIVTPDGRRIGRLSPVLKGFPVKEVQYLQRVIESVEVTLVKDAGFTEKTENNVLTELQKRLGQKIEIIIKYADHIPRSKRGKLKSIVSLLNKTEHRKF